MLNFVYVFINYILENDEIQGPERIEIPILRRVTLQYVVENLGLLITVLYM